MVMYKKEVLMLTGVDISYSQRMRDVCCVELLQFRDDVSISYGISCDLPAYVARLSSQSLNLWYVRYLWPRISDSGNLERPLRRWNRSRVRRFHFRNLNRELALRRFWQGLWSGGKKRLQLYSKHMY